jgi:hypothetical protein
MSIPVARFFFHVQVKKGSCFGIDLRSAGESNVEKEGANRTLSEKISSSPPMKRLKTIPTEEDLDLPDDVKGQHAAELLMEIPFSTVRDSNKKCAFGLIIQATRVSWFDKVTTAFPAGPTLFLKLAYSQGHSPHFKNLKKM